MKRRDVVKALLAAGFDLREGAKHTHILGKGEKVSVLSRQREINLVQLKMIECQTGARFSR